MCGMRFTFPLRELRPLANALVVTLKLRFNAANMREHEQDKQGRQNEPREMSANNHNGNRGQHEEKRAHHERRRTFARTTPAILASGETGRS
jgi:hypothetical protein